MKVKRTKWVCRECLDTPCKQSVLEGKQPCTCSVFPGLKTADWQPARPKKKSKPKRVEARLTEFAAETREFVADNVTPLHSRIAELEQWKDEHDSYHYATEYDTGENDDSLPGRPIPLKEAIATALATLETAEEERALQDIPPLPDGYLVVPEPGGKVITETMMCRTRKVWAHVVDDYGRRGDTLISAWKEGEIIDIAENVLPDAPEGTHLHKVQDGDRWEEGDRPWNTRALRWYLEGIENRPGRLSGCVGEPIKTLDRNQGYICRKNIEESSNYTTGEAK